MNNTSMEYFSMGTLLKQLADIIAPKEEGVTTIVIDSSKHVTVWRHDTENGSECIGNFKFGEAEQIINNISHESITQRTAVQDTGKDTNDL